VGIVDTATGLRVNVILVQVAAAEGPSAPRKDRGEPTRTSLQALHRAQLTFVSILRLPLGVSDRNMGDGRVGVKNIPALRLLINVAHHENHDQANDAD
jgi:hypothetical protein